MTTSITHCARLYYIHDPMCSWCWGFRPAWQQLRANLPAEIELVSRVGGLAPDSDQPMDPALREQLQATWKRIMQQIPGTEFNFEFWSRNTPRRSTYPACRAVISARQMNNLDAQMTLAIQQAYYLQARNPSDLEVLADCAHSIGLERDAFIQHMTSPQLEQDFDHELQQVRALGVNSFPSLLLEQGNTRWDIPLRYTSAQAMLEDINQLLGIG